MVDSLCKNGADANVTDGRGNCPLWAALKSRQFEIAETLVNICQSLRVAGKTTTTSFNPVNSMLITGTITAKQKVRQKVPGLYAVCR